MDRREFGIKATSALALVGLAGCQSADAGDLPVRCTPDAEMLRKFERILWDTVAYAAKTAVPGIGFKDEWDCIEKYKKHGDDWYSKMKVRLCKAVAGGIGDPTDLDDGVHDAEIHYYFNNFYACCTLAGRKAARLAVKDGENWIDGDKHFVPAMGAVHQSLKNKIARAQRPDCDDFGILAGMCS